MAKPNLTQVSSWIYSGLRAWTDSQPLLGTPDPFPQQSLGLLVVRPSEGWWLGAERCDHFVWPRDVLFGMKNVLYGFSMSTTVSSFFMSRVVTSPGHKHIPVRWKDWNKLLLLLIRGNHLLSDRYSSEQSCSPVLSLTSPAPPWHKRTSVFPSLHTDGTFWSLEGLRANSAEEKSMLI